MRTDAILNNEAWCCTMYSNHINTTFVDFLRSSVAATILKRKTNPAVVAAATAAVTVVAATVVAAATVAAVTVVKKELANLKTMYRTDNQFF